MRLSISLLALSICLSSISLFAQNRECGTMLRDQVVLQNNPQLAKIRQQGLLNFQSQVHTFAVDTTIITIPVVVHVVYNKTAENISDAQIMSQINVLNRDYRHLNKDTTKIPAPWKSVASDSKIEFCLAKKDPAGNDTNGITRTFTTSTQFSYNDQVKHNSSGGADGWDSQKYLNLWVCNLGTSLYGFATFPSDLSTAPAEDGVVITYDAFGTVGSSAYPSDGGRTSSHEIGHWLGLYHIWGDDGTGCTGTDYIADTPNQAGANYGCKLTFPHTDNCTTTSPGVMYMNYMDYGDDACLIMFTKDQSALMAYTLATYRSAILKTTLCQGPSNTIGINELKENTFSIYPNPSNGVFTIKTAGTFSQLQVFNLVGQCVYQKEFSIDQTKTVTLDLGEQNNGIYSIKMSGAKGYSTQKILLNH